MAEAKIEIKIGEILFSGEGNDDWLSTQLDKILEKAGDFTKISPPSDNSSSIQTGSHEPADFSRSTEIASKPLATFLKEKNINGNQVARFLLTAIWLEAKGQTRLKTIDIGIALKGSKQSRLTNPSGCLNKNVAKGFCEKDGKEFFVTQQGKDEMGIQ